jgi:sialate O-acetylesterase
MGKYAVLALLFACAAAVAAPVTEKKAEFPPRPLTLLYTTFQDHAVLQRGKPIPVWGLATPGAAVEVSLAGAKVAATAGADGNWQAVLPAMAAGGPYELTAKTASQSQSVKDVMLGDVYLCSGQSNMELPMRLANNYDVEIRGAKNTAIRLFHVQRFSSPLPRTTFGADAGWAVTSPETVKEFSAACYYFGRSLQPAAGVAVGLIESAWGGSVIQAWLGKDALRALGGYEQPLDVLDSYVKDTKAGDRKWRDMALAWWQAHDPALAAMPAWNDPALDDSGWSSFALDGSWRDGDDPVLKRWDGIVWVRKSFELSADQAKGAARLALGAVDRTDTTWINGVEIGAQDGYDVDRLYEIPAGTLHAGKNLLAVGILAGGGLVSPPGKLALKLGDGSSVPLAGSWRYKLSAPYSKTGRTPHVPWLNQLGVSVLYNGMILPLGPTPLRGIVWYQGESDSYQPREYARLLPAFIAEMQARFGAETPVFQVQLPSFGPAVSQPGVSDWAATREVQRRTAESMANVDYAVTIDLGAREVIHPALKQEVGRRLALLAGKRVYGKTLEERGPVPLSAARKANTVTLRFGHVGQGLKLEGWDRPVGFALCDTANRCRYAQGKAGRDTISLDAKVLPKAVKVRYAWADSPLCNLVNSEGLPAVPFEIAIGR